MTLPVQVAATTSTTISVGATQPVPGLNDVSTDSSGRHVYAVGNPYFNFDYVPPASATVGPTSFGPGRSAAANIYAVPTSGTALLDPTGTTPSSPVATGSILVRLFEPARTRTYPASAVNQYEFLTFLPQSCRPPPSQYSGSYGVSNSWVVQTAPAIPGMWYSLMAVTVLRGHTTIAVGGSPFGLAYDAYKVLAVNAGATYSVAAAAPFQQSGVLLTTLNGGFSWLSMVRCVPAKRRMHPSEPSHALVL